MARLRFRQSTCPAWQPCAPPHNRVLRLAVSVVEAARTRSAAGPARTAPFHDPAPLPPAPFAGTARHTKRSVAMLGQAFARQFRFPDANFDFAACGMHPASDHGQVCAAGVPRPRRLPRVRAATGRIHDIGENDRRVMRRKLPSTPQHHAHSSIRRFPPPRACAGPVLRDVSRWPWP